MDRTRPLEYRVLGPVEVLESGTPLSLGGPRQRALLALLLLHANESVSTNRLIDDLWAEDAPESGASAIQNQVARLRRAIGSDRITTQQSGYSIVVAPGEFDLDRHRRLVAEASTEGPGRRSALLAEADSLWHGEPLAGLPDAPFVVRERGRLDDLRLAALEDRIDADLELGRHAVLVGELSGLAARYPFRERLRGQLMLALYRSGRQAEALDVYRETRSLLADELGLEPSQTLRDLERSILAQSSSLDLQQKPEERPPPDLDDAVSDDPAVADRKPLHAVRAAEVAVLSVLLVVAGVVSASVVSHDPAQTSAVPTTASTSEPSSSPGSTSSLQAPKTVGSADETTEASSSPSATTRSAATTGSVPTSKPIISTGATRSADTTSKDSPKRPTTPRKATPTATTPKATPPTATTKTPTPTTPTTTTGPAATTPEQGPFRVEDDFTSAIVDPTIWHTIVEGTGAEARIEAGRAVVTIAATGKPGGTYNTVGAHLGTQCSFPADFDARVEFELLDWAAGNNVRAGIHAFFADSFVGRISSSTWGDQYSSWVIPANGPLALAEPTGRLRIARVGTTMTTYIWHKERWTALASGVSTGTAVIGLETRAEADFGHQATRVAFDNFTVEAMRVACPPGSVPPRTKAP